MFACQGRTTNPSRALNIHFRAALSRTKTSLAEGRPQITSLVPFEKRLLCTVRGLHVLPRRFVENSGVIVQLEAPNDLNSTVFPNFKLRIRNVGGSTVTMRPEKW